jgi:hypothetical protein
MTDKEAGKRTDIAQRKRKPKRSRASIGEKAGRTDNPPIKAHISDDWMEGYVLHPEAISPAIAARMELRGFDNSAIHGLWQGTLGSLALWVIECGSQPRPKNSLLDPTQAERSSTIESRLAALKVHEPWELAGTSIRDPIDMLEMLRAKPAGYPRKLFSEVPYTHVIAAAMLFEIARGDSEGALLGGLLTRSPVALCNQHLLAAIKGQRILDIYRRDELIKAAMDWINEVAPKVQKTDDLLSMGRALGAQKKRIDAEKNSTALWQAARNYFGKYLSKGYPACARALLDPGEYPRLRTQLVVNKKSGKLMSEGTLIKKIAGAKEAALKAIEKERQP